MSLVVKMPTLHIRVLEFDSCLVQGSPGLLSQLLASASRSPLAFVGIWIVNQQMGTLCAVLSNTTLMEKGHAGR